MPLTKDAIGIRFPVKTVAVELDDARRFAAATGDDPEYYRAAGVAPPMMAARLAHRSLQAVLDDADFGLRNDRLLHAEQDMAFGAPLRLGEDAVVSTEVVDVAPYGLGTACFLAITLEQASGGVTTSTTAVVVPSDGAELGDRRRRRAGAARGEQVAQATLAVDDDAAARYAEASGDHNPIHLDPDAARAAGLPGVILHGMCTLALATTAAVDALAGGDPARLRAVRARFSRPVSPGDVLSCRWSATDQPGLYAMAVSVDGKAVLKDAAVEVD